MSKRRKIEQAETALEIDETIPEVGAFELEEHDQEVEDLTEMPEVAETLVEPELGIPLTLERAFEVRGDGSIAYFQG